jgi:hypothetical protein
VVIDTLLSVSELQIEEQRKQARQTRREAEKQAGTRLFDSPHKNKALAHRRELLASERDTPEDAPVLRWILDSSKRGM